MIETKKILFLFMLVIFFQTSFAQFEYLQINLEIQTLRKENNHIRISLFREDSVSYYLGIKKNPHINDNDPDTWLKRDADTIIIISKDTFNRISEQSMNLSSSMIMKGMNSLILFSVHGGSTFNLEIVVTMDKISYSIWSPTINTKERNLEPYLALCKEILILAKIKPEDWFL